MFELELSRFLNHKGRDGAGHCCGGDADRFGNCSNKCRIKFRVCLNVYQQVIDIRSPCTFGEITTPILGNNEINFNAIDGFMNPVQFSLDSWQVRPKTTVIV